MPTYAYTGSVQTVTVPGPVVSANIEIAGGGGGDEWAPGNVIPQGAHMVGELTGLTPGATLYIYVGGHGADSSGTTNAGAGGYNGGGDGGTGAGGGGGASDIRQGGTALSDRIVVAGGAGGNGGNWGSTGFSNGAGIAAIGSDVGGDGTVGAGSVGNRGTGGGGGNLGAGGSGGSSFGTGGSAGVGGTGGTRTFRSGGGGGAGLYGGGGGGGALAGGSGGGGGGGSSYVDNLTAGYTVVSNSTSRNGFVVITWIGLGGIYVDGAVHLA